MPSAGPRSPPVRREQFSVPSRALTALASEPPASSIACELRNDERISQASGRTCRDPCSRCGLRSSRCRQPCSRSYPCRCSSPCSNPSGQRRAPPRGSLRAGWHLHSLPSRQRASPTLPTLPESYRSSYRSLLQDPPMSGKPCMAIAADSRTLSRDVHALYARTLRRYRPPSPLFVPKRASRQHCGK